MSHLLDYLCKSSAEPEDYGSFMDFQEDMKNLDLPLTLDNPELMSSEFFDSVLSMEQESFGLEGEFAGDPGAESPRSSESGDSLALGSESGGSLGSEETRPLGPEPVVYDPQPAKLVLQPNTKRVIFTKPMNAAAAVAGAKNNKGKQQVIRVQSISGNGRSLLLPVNVKNVKKIKIINANDLKMENIKVTGPGNASFLKKQQAQLEKIESTDEDEEQDHHPQDSRYPPLNLTAEEKRLLVKEGIKLPTHYPLTKNEEKELKRIRRKIRNKISAQDSRKRKKEYVDKLEEKAKRTTEENEFLKKRIKLLRKQNGRLLEQMRKLQAVLFSTTSTKATPTTCLMIVLFSTLLVCLPNLRPTEKREVGEGQLFAARRALLFNQKATEEDVGEGEFLVFGKDEDEEEPENATDDFSTFLTELARKYESLPREDRNCSEINNNDEEDEFCRDRDVRNNVFIEPDISDDEGGSSSIKEEPPSKKAKLEENHMDRKEK